MIVEPWQTIAPVVKIISVPAFRRVAGTAREGAHDNTAETF